MGSIPVRVTMPKIQCLAHWIFLRLRPPKSCEGPILHTLFPGFPQSYSHSPQTYPQKGDESLFVGAMKIARNFAVSGRWGEWYAPLPAPSLRELSSECETEGVYFDERKSSQVSEFIMASGESVAWRNHRTTLPQLRIRSAAPSEREPGGVRTTQRAARKPESFGRFSSPLRKLRRAYVLPSIRLPRNRNVAGVFHRPESVCIFLPPCWGGRNFYGKAGAFVD